MKKYFSVFVSLSINGVKYRPSICYPLSPLVEDAIEALAKKGQAAMYDGEVRFVSGRAVPVAAVSPPPTYSNPVPEAPAKKKSRKVRF
jgi:hypothetical protein